MEKNKKRNTVVIVDDDEELLKLLISSFKWKGFTVKAFNRGTAAYTYLSNKKNLGSVCLIVLDRLLPDMDGLTILQKLGNHKAIPILILSILSAEKDVLKGFNEGAVEYVPKPFSMPVLMEKAMRWIAA